MNKSLPLFVLPVSFFLLMASFSRPSTASVTINSLGQVVRSSLVLGDEVKVEVPEVKVEDKKVSEIEFKKPEDKKVEDSRAQVEVQNEGNHFQAEIQSQGGRKVHIEKEDGKFKMKVEDAQGNEIESIEPEGDNLLDVEELDDHDKVKVSTTSASTLMVTRNHFSAETEFPLSVDLKTNQLNVTTPAGSKVVSVLPDQAIKGIFEHRDLDEIGGKSFEDLVKESSSGASVSQSVSGSVRLTSDSNGSPVYEVTGSKTWKVFGLLPVTLPQSLAVSAQTGAVETVNQSWISWLMSLISTR